MLEKTLEELPEEQPLLMHSDQGWYYLLKEYRHTLKSRGIVQKACHVKGTVMRTR